MVEGAPTAPRRRRVRSQVKWGIYAIALFVILNYLVLPQLAGARKSEVLLGKINIAYVIAGVVLEAGSLVAYSRLTHTVLRQEGPGPWRLFRINFSSLAVSHIMPGGTAPGTAVAYRLLTQSGVPGTDAGFALAMQGVGSALVLNSILWLALLVSVFVHGYNPLYAVAAGAGVVLMGTFAAVVVALTRGRNRSVEVIRRWSGHIPFLDGDKVANQVRRIAVRLGRFLAERQLLTRAVGWAAVFWLLDAASLFVFIAALGKLVSPIDLLVAYGLANVLAVIPVTPSGLGVIEGVLIPTLTGFGVSKPAATLGVLGWRLVNFWLPIPVGGIAYLSLRFDNEGWRQRLRHARGAVAGLDHTAADVEARRATDALSVSGRNGAASASAPGSGGGGPPAPPARPRPGGDEARRYRADGPEARGDARRHRGAEAAFEEQGHGGRP
ncbi:MAG TPA: YbhN family protein [Acidimicrobiales bacterium]|nr:YbhN family protein [Acidimicrobiales bacterium]